MKTVGAWVLALVVVIGAGVGAEAGLGIRTNSGPARSALAVKIDQFALNFVAGRGVPVTSVSSVSTDLASLATGVSGDPSAGPRTTLYVLEMRGHFHVGPAPHERRSLPAVNVMHLILAVSGTGFKVVSQGVGGDWPPLIAYGTPETDSLVGVAPSP